MVSVQKTNRQTKFQEKDNGIFITKGMVKQSKSHGPVNRYVGEFPRTGPLGRRGSMPGDTGLRYRDVGLET